MSYEIEGGRQDGGTPRRVTVEALPPKRTALEEYAAHKKSLSGLAARLKAQFSELECDRRLTQQRLDDIEQKKLDVHSALKELETGE